MRQHVPLAASLLVNAGLAVFLALPASEQSGPARHEVREAAVAPLQAPVVDSSTAKEQARPAAAEMPPSAERARSIHGVRELVAELRRRGVDEGTVRRLGVAHAERLFRIEARALVEQPRSTEYWRSPADMSRFGDVDATKLREFQRLRRQRVEVLDELFGDVEAEATEHNTVNHYLYARPLGYDYAPPDKRLELTEFFEREAAGVGRTPVQRLLTQSMPAPKRELELAGKVRDILGPALFDDYLLQSSGISTRLRYELTAFQPTRAEFDQLVRAEYALLGEQADALLTARRASRDGSFDPASVSKLEEARREAARGVLGDARYADFERATDEAYVYLDQLARELGLGPSVARSAFAHVERARKQVLALPEAANMADPKVMDAMRKIRAETQDRLADELGLQSLNRSEQQMILGQALSLHPKQMSQRMFRWF